VRQDDIGSRITAMFENTRAEVKRQIQSHMALVDKAASTGELKALNEEALRKAGARLTSTGSLPAIGTGSGSGSGVVKLPSGAAQQAAVASAPPPQKKSSGALLILVAVVVLVAVACAFVVSRFVGKSKEIASGTASGTPIAADTSTTAPTAPQTSTAAPQPSDTATPTASASAAPAPSDTTKPKKKPAWMLVDAGLPVAANTATSTSTAPSSTAEPDSTGPGFLTLDTVPWTRVSEGGRSLGTTPILGIPLSPGPHTLFLENPGEGIRTSLNVNIESGKRTGRRIVLKQPTQ
jgi:serine/threonine-protein kinase